MALPGAYLVFLLISLIGLFTIDRKFQLAWPVNKKATLLTVSISVAFFLIWDAAGIAMGIFFIGDADVLTGLQLAPEMPIEEPVFLTLFIYTTLLVYRFIERRKLGR